MMKNIKISHRLKKGIEFYLPPFFISNILKNYFTKEEISLKQGFLAFKVNSKSKDS